MTRTRTSRNKAHPLVLGCLTDERSFFTINLKLSSFKVIQWNNSPKSVKYHFFPFFSPFPSTLWQTSLQIINCFLQQLHLVLLGNPLFFGGFFYAPSIWRMVERVYSLTPVPPPLPGTPTLSDKICYCSNHYSTFGDKCTLWQTSLQIVNCFLQQPHLVLPGNPLFFGVFFMPPPFEEWWKGI